MSILFLSPEKQSTQVAEALQAYARAVAPQTQTAILYASRDQRDSWPVIGADDQVLVCLTRGWRVNPWLSEGIAQLTQQLGKDRVHGLLVGIEQQDLYGPVAGLTCLPATPDALNKLLGTSSQAAPETSWKQAESVIQQLSTVPSLTKSPVDVLPAFLDLLPTVGPVHMAGQVVLTDAVPGEASAFDVIDFLMANGVPDDKIVQYKGRLLAQHKPDNVLDYIDFHREEVQGFV